MSILTANMPTLWDLQKRMDPNGEISVIAEVLNLMNEILRDMPVIEGNLETGHLTTVRTGLPTVAWRQLNYGVQPSKSTTKQVTDTCGLLEAYSVVDKELLRINRNDKKFRLSEEIAFMEAMNQAMATTLFYGNTDVNPERFLGLAPRFSSLAAASGANIIDAGGTGSDNTSIWLICWGDKTVHGIYPKGTQAGLEYEDLKQQTEKDAAGGNYEVMKSHWIWRLGLTVRDWRYIVRICNIDISDLLTAGDASDSSANILKYMIRAMNLLPAFQLGRKVFYCNNAVLTALQIKLMWKGNNFLTMSDWTNGQIQEKVLTFMGIPVRRCDAIISAESRVT